MMLSDVCLTFDVCLTSVSYIGPKSSIGTEVAHVTPDSDSTFKVKRSKVKVTGAGHYGGIPHCCFAMCLVSVDRCLQLLTATIGNGPPIYLK